MDSHNSPSTSQTNSDSDTEFSEFILPGFKIAKRRKVKVYKRFDWLFFTSFQGITAIVTLFNCLIIATLILMSIPNCPQKVFEVVGHCIIAEALAVWSLITFILLATSCIMYVAHFIENLNQSNWLLIEYYTYILQFMAWLLVSYFTMAHNGIFILIGSLGLLTSLSFLLMACQRNYLYRQGKPAQEFIDDPDGDRRRRKKMMTHFLSPKPGQVESEVYGTKSSQNAASIRELTSDSVGEKNLKTDVTTSISSTKELSVIAKDAKSLPKIA